MLNQKPTYQTNKILWRNLATVAGVFSFVICLLIIVNYFQLNRIDPVETIVLDELVSRLNQNPEDEQLREQIRTLDLLARKAYFTNQWQIRMGGYLLLIGVLVTIAAFQMLLSAEKKKVNLKPEIKTDLMFMQKQTRRWVTGFSTILIAVTLIFAFLTYRQLGSSFNQTLAEITQQNTEQPTSEIESNQVIEETDLTDKTENISPEKNKAKKDITPTQDLETKKEAVTVESKVESTIETATKPEETPAKTKPIESKSVESNSESNTYSSETPGFKYAIPYGEKVAKNFNAFRGPGGNGVTYHTNIPENWNGETGENILWKTKIPLSGFNSPVIWEDKIFLTGADQSNKEVYCFDRETGEILWATSVKGIPGSPEKAPKVPDYTGYAAPTGTTDGKYFYAIFADADVAAFDFEGKMVWGKNLGVPDNHYGYSSSLLLYNDKLIIQWDQRNVQKVMALDKETGETAWETNRDVKISWASPVIAQLESGPQLLLAADPLVVSYNPDTGEELWKLDCLSGEVGPSIAAYSNMVFALNEYASLVGIKIGDQPEKVWEDYGYLSDVPSPVATDKHLIVATSYGVIVCFANETGEMLWEAEFDNSIYASPMIAEGKVYLIDMQGVMHIFKPGDEYQHIVDCPLGEGSVCTPAFMDGRIYIRGDEHLYCIGKE